MATKSGPTVQPSPSEAEIEEKKNGSKNILSLSSSATRTDQDDDSLQFLKQFKAKQQQQQKQKSSKEAADDGETEITEVHDNTSTTQELKRLQQQRLLIAAKNKNDARERLIKEGSSNPSDHCTCSSSSSSSSTPQHQNVNPRDTMIKLAEETPGKASPVQGFPTYYDNPYHNPLVASAMKPNDLFRKSGTNQSQVDDSDVDSNASEFGTVIGAPASMLSNRFTEVEAMEREQHYPDDNVVDSSDNQQPVRDMFDLEDDPELVNYKAFRCHSDAEGQVDDQVDDSTNFHDVNSILPEPSKSPTMDAGGTETVHHDDNDEKSSTPKHGNSKPKQLGDISSEELRKRDELSSTPIRDADDGETSLSVVDSEIDQLVKRSASDSSGAGPVKSCSSNNSAEVFRVPSTGSRRMEIQHGKPPKGNHTPRASPPSSTAGRAFSAKLSNESEKEDEELQAIDADTRSNVSSNVSTVSGEQRKKRPDSSLQRALSNPNQITTASSNQSPSKHSSRKEDEKEEKEDELCHQQQYHFEVPKEEEGNKEFGNNIKAADSSHHASTGSPGTDLANSLRRIGDKLIQRSPRNGIKKAPAESQSLFDIGDEDGQITGCHDSSQNIHTFHQPNITRSAPTTPRLQRKERQEQQQVYHSGNDYSLAKIQEAFPQSPSRDGAGRSKHALESFLLRSPGSSARLMADFRRESSSSSGSGGTRGTRDGDSQRFWNGRIPSILRSDSSPPSVGNEPTPRSKGGRRGKDSNALQLVKADPLRFARGCMSFDTTVDQRYDYDEHREEILFRATTASNTPNEDQWLRTTKSYDVRHQGPASPVRPAASAFRQRFKDFGGKITGKKGQTQTLYESSRSWDFSSGKASSAVSTMIGTGTSSKSSQEGFGTEGVTLDASAFRAAPYLRHERQLKHPHDQRLNRFYGDRLASAATTGHIFTDQQHQEKLELLQTPQRIEIEREDALNLLACLCERGITLQSQDDGPKVSSGENFELSCPAKALPVEESSKGGLRDSQLNQKKVSKVELETETIDTALDKLREISKGLSSGESCDEQEKASSSSNHKLRMEVLDQLKRSHTYALEMQRASMSANAWLRSIRHSDSKEAQDDKPIAKPEKEEAETCETGDAKSDVDVLALKAMLHQAQIKAREKSEEARKLNEELSECRAEIGRLRSVSRSNKNSFTSPNRSILDDDDDESTVSTAERDSAKRKNADGNPIIKKVESKLLEEDVVDLDSSFIHEENAEVLRDSDQPVVRELIMFKSALADANSIIKKLHAELQEAKPSGCSVAPIIEVSEKAFSVALVDQTAASPDKSNSFSPDHKTINVRMLDGENFVTDWDEAGSLPPPPDHGLRSPIVNALLQQWSDDEGLHNSLLSWMDRAISGEDPALIPPLTLSSLDHQVRDGFMMHILPLLLRRPDIVVDVKTRAHRTTTYDIAVSVSKNGRAPFAPVRVLPDIDPAPDAVSAVNSATHSSVTAHVHNGHLAESDMYAAGASSNYSSLLPHRSSDDRSENAQQQQQGGIMGALGGAIGGLLSRRKPDSSHYYDAGIPAINNSYDMGSAAGAAGTGPMDFPPHTPKQRIGTEYSDEDPQLDSDEPYHRLVSAPPGRIGVSFVEYRGHAMVAEVSEDSPLYGWVFPSDILIGKILLCIDIQI